MSSTEPSDVTHFDSPSELREWFLENHAERDVLWVGFWKKATGKGGITWKEAVDVAICFGWIDGIRKRIDDEAYTNRFTPRRPGSNWSRRNIERYEALRDEGLIEPPGRAAFERRPDEPSGAYAHDRDDPPPLGEDLLERFQANEKAWADWQERPPGYRKTVRLWVMSAKRESTRERRFQALLDDSEAGRKIKPLR